MITNFTLQTDLSGPLYRQVFETLRKAILDGALKPQQKLPGSRELAAQLNVSRNTINSAYEMLQAEGYIQSLRGSGFYVVELPTTLVTPTTPSIPPDNIHNATPEHFLSRRGRQLAAITRAVPKIRNPAFQPGLPDLSQFPARLWQQCLNKVAQNMDSKLTHYQDQGGLAALKNALRDYLRTSRGAKCDADDIVIVNGSQAGLDLVARMCVNPNECIAIENPGYLGARDGFLAADARLIPIDVDEHGIQVQSLQHASQEVSIRLVYVTPSYQFPSGVTMSAQRRMELLYWAATHNAFILEDDYDSELRYAGQPLSCLQGLDRHRRVIYLGTFSKVMFPGLRLGYLVLPPGLAQPFASALRKTGQDPPLLLQAAMAQFIEENHFARHLRKMRKLYAEKRRVFVELLSHHLGDWLGVEAADAGMQMACYYRCEVDENKLIQMGKENDLVLAPLSRYYYTDSEFASDANLSTPGNALASNVRPGLFLGYAGVDLALIEANILTLKKIIKLSRR